MKVLIISIVLAVWASNGHALSCTASPTNNDPTVIIKCYAKMLSHFEQILKRELAYNYANHLKNSEKLNDGKFRRKYYSKLFNELEQVQRMLHRLNYPDPRPAVRCEAPSEGDDDSG